MSGWSKWLALLMALVPVLFGFVIPFLILASYALESVTAGLDSQWLRYSWNSLSVALTASTITVVVGLLISYGKRQQNRYGASIAHRLAGIGYAMPGAVLAIGVVILFGGVDRHINAIFEEWFNYSPGLLFSGTMFSLLFAYVVRFPAIATGGIDSSLSRISPSMDHASRSLGFSALATMRRVHLPMVRSSLFTVALVVFVDIMKELPVTLLLRPFNFETLATHVYYYASDEMLRESSLAALMIVLVGLGPVILLSRNVAAHREG